MNTKIFSIFLQKINILKNIGSHIYELENIENKLLLEAIKYQKFDDEEFDNIIVNINLYKEFDALLNNFSYKVKNEINKITNKKKDMALICKDCNVELFMVDDGYLCNICGVHYDIPIVFYEPKTVKRKSTNANYCDEWINYLQGKAMVCINENLFEELLKKTREKCTFNGNFSKNMLHLLTCKDIRTWLSALRYSKYYKYIPFLHRRITRELGAEITPPQFNIEEERMIRLDWQYLNETFTREYKKLKVVNKKKNNSTYYPIFILFIVRMRFTTDDRAKRLEFYVHLQSTETYKLRLQCWETTCKIMKYNGKNKY